MEKALKEIHSIIEQLHMEEKHLSPEERVEKIRKEAEDFIRTRELKVKRISWKV